MANVKFSALPANTTPLLTDSLPMLDDPAGTPVTQELTFKNLQKASFMFSIVGSDFTLAAASGVQSAFPSTGDVWTLAASTAYWFDGLYYITKGTTTCTIALAFALAGGASVTSILYWAQGQHVAINTTGTTQSSCCVDTVASTVVLATGTTAAQIKFQGIIRMNAGGTVTPQINFSANPTGTNLMKLNSHIRFRLLGTNTDNVYGDVA